MFKTVVTRETALVYKSNDAVRQDDLRGDKQQLKLPGALPGFHRGTNHASPGSPVKLHCKKRIFLSPAGMSLTKVSGREKFNNFRQGRVW
jgi:hypothetical protein